MRIVVVPPFQGGGTSGLKGRTYDGCEGHNIRIRVAAVIPAYNEARSIATGVEGIRGVVDRVIVVDDGSSDDTAARARMAGAEAIALAANGGKGAAVRTGLARVFEGEFTHVLLLDADMQHLPEEAASLVAEAERS